MTVTVRPMEPPDRDRGFRAYVDSYGAGSDLLASLAEVPLDNRWVAVDESGVVGILRALPFEQCYGGRAVGSVGVAAVAVALEARSRGVSRQLMTGFLEAERERGTPLSILYMSTIAAYRPVGYELAGSRVRYQYPIEHLPRAQPLPVVAWDDGDLADIAACLERIAHASSGMMVRPEYWWATRAFGQLEGDQYLYRYRVVEDGRTTGFVVYTVCHEVRTDFPIQWTRDADCIGVVVRDLFWETAEAARSLLGFLAAQRTLGTNIYWTGPPNDPLMAFMPEHLPQTQSAYQWMNRIVHVTNALTVRGYPTYLSGSLDITVTDPVLTANQGSYRLRIDKGRAEVEPIDSADLTVTCNGLAGIYTGWWSCAAAAAAGLLSGGTDETRALVDAAFAGPTPWLNEYF